MSKPDYRKLYERAHRLRREEQQFIQMVDSYGPDSLEARAGLAAADHVHEQLLKMWYWACNTDDETMKAVIQGAKHSLRERNHSINNYVTVPEHQQTLNHRISGRRLGHFRKEMTWRAIPW